jgi:hypothetical protein
MKTSIGLLLLLLLGLFLVSAQAQDKATLSSYRVIPKLGKDAELKKAIAAHAAKFHTGDWKWRVFSVLSGADEGGYQINEGPTSWTTLEGRNDISEEHMRDYEANILPLVDRSTPNGFFLYQRELSSDSAVGPMKKALLRHFFLKPGKAPKLSAYLTTWKKVWQKLGLKVAVWASVFSGEPQYVVSYRLPQGFIDLEQPWTQRLKNGYEEIAGAGSYAKYLDDIGLVTDKIVEDIIELQPDLGSK